MGLLCAGQALDLMTTHVDLTHGAVEGNFMAAGLMSAGGLGLLALVKLTLVGAMFGAVALVEDYSRDHPGPSSRLARIVVWRALQVCVVVLFATGLHNVAVLAQIQGWLPAAVSSAWPQIA